MPKKNFDSEFCGNLPLNNVNLIQDYGYLLVADRRDLSIIQVSENAADLFKLPNDEIIEKKLDQFFDVKSLNAIDNLIQKNLRDRVPINIRIKGEELRSVLLHVYSEYIILEVEKPGNIDKRFFTSVFNDLKYAIAGIETADTVVAASKAAVHELRKISGFDGVLMYRFDSDWNGTVIAEEKTDLLEAYLGQTFPASDIPRQARELYLKNPYRQIPDREYIPYGLFPVVNPVTNTFLDLSGCNLRAVPSVHREYMKNMGISASMSIRVIVNNELWGLISCHHIQPKYIDFEMCAIFELLSTVISARISSILYREQSAASQLLHKTRLSISDKIYQTGDFTSSLFESDDDNILGMFDATGAVLNLNGRQSSAGSVPDHNFIDDLLLWIDSKNFSGAFGTNNLQNFIPEAVSFKDIASGLLVIPVNPAKSEYLLCFRPEVQATIDWGGNPNNAINFDPDGKNYHPRNSFTLWKEKIEYQSEPWMDIEIDAANALSAFMFKLRSKTTTR